MPGTLDTYSFAANDAVWSEGNLRAVSGKAQPFKLERDEATGYLRRRYPTAPLTHDAPETLMDKLLPTVGASLPVRDKTDLFFIEKLRQNQSKLPVLKSNMANWKPYGSQNDRMEQYIPWEDADCPPPAAGAAGPVDTDKDGMPDDWEKANGLNPSDPADGAIDTDQDGYTNVEEYLYRTNPKVAVDYTKKENNVNTVK